VETPDVLFSRSTLYINGLPKHPPPFRRPLTAPRRLGIESDQSGTAPPEGPAHGLRAVDLIFRHGLVQSAALIAHRGGSRGASKSIG
jgi:hypothetical protein